MEISEDTTTPNAAIFGSLGLRTFEIVNGLGHSNWYLTARFMHNSDFSAIIQQVELLITWHNGWSLGFFWRFTFFSILLFLFGLIPFPDVCVKGVSRAKNAFYLTVTVGTVRDFGNFVLIDMAVFVYVEGLDHSLCVVNSSQLPCDLRSVLPIEAFAIVRRVPYFDEMGVVCIAIIDVFLFLEFDSGLPRRWC